MPAIAHQTEEQLELYALGRLPEQQVEILEEHLLICPSCQEKLDQVEAFAVGMRTAISTEPVAEPRDEWFGWFNFRPVRYAAVLGGFAAILLAVASYLHSDRSKLAPLATLQLTSIRGAGASVGPARETDITLADAPEESGMRIEVVDSVGGKVWSGPFDAANRTVKLAGPLAQGSYFIRLNDNRGNLLHEYGFAVHAPS